VAARSRTPLVDGRAAHRHRPPQGAAREPPAPHPQPQ
jgi:hypothetical protein